MRTRCPVPFTNRFDSFGLVLTGPVLRCHRVNDDGLEATMTNNPQAKRVISQVASWTATQTRKRLESLLENGHSSYSPTELKWTDKNGAQWEVEFEWAAINDGQIECIGVRLRSVAGRRTRAVTSDVWRQVPIGTLVGRARRSEAARWRRAPESEAVAAARLRFGGTSIRAQQGRTLTEEDLAEVAAVYRDAVERGEPPVQAVRKRFHIAPGTARKRVARARDAGMLGPAVPGRAGEATPRSNKQKGNR